MCNYIAFALFILALLTGKVHAQESAPAANNGLLRYTAAHNIFAVHYPENYSVTYESDVVKFVEPKDKGISMAAFTYLLKKDITVNELIMALAATSEIDESNFEGVPCKFSAMAKGEGYTGNKYWLWWGGVFNQRLVVVSAKKTIPFTEGERQLLQLAIQNLEIN